MYKLTLLLMHTYDCYIFYSRTLNIRHGKGSTQQKNYELFKNARRNTKIQKKKIKKKYKFIESY